MDYKVDEIFKEICNLILFEKKSLKEWAEIESDDMFQNEKYVGGFDANEMEFCFSMYENGIEYWFQVSLKEVEDIMEVTSRLICNRASLKTKPKRVKELIERIGNVL